VSFQAGSGSSARVASQQTTDAHAIATRSNEFIEMTFAGNQDRRLIGL